MAVQSVPGFIDLSVVLPCLNEAGNLRALLPELRGVLDSLGIRWEIVVVDGDSTDDTRAVAEGEGARYVNEPRKGYGAAIQRGFAEARGEYVATMDADQSHPSAFIASLWAARDQGDIVIASRYVPGGAPTSPGPG